MAFIPLSSLVSSSAHSNADARPFLHRSQSAPCCHRRHLSHLSIANNDLADALSGPTPYQSFEPQVNVPALGAFVFIAVIFGLLQLRIGQISSAAQRRTLALETLRQVKSLQLSGTDDSSASATKGGKSSVSSMAETSVKEALEEYEVALRDEMSLRQVIPGVVRIAAPNDPKGTEADLAAARQFLGLEISDAGDVVPVGEGSALADTDTDATTSTMASTVEKTKDVQKQEEDGISNGSKAVLIGVAILQIGLLFLLSFDPMKPATDSIF